ARSARPDVRRARLDRVALADRAARGRPRGRPHPPRRTAGARRQLHGRRQPHPCGAERARSDPEPPPPQILSRIDGRSPRSISPQGPPRSVSGAREAMMPKTTIFTFVIAAASAASGCEGDQGAPGPQAPPGGIDPATPAIDKAYLGAGGRDALTGLTGFR